MYMPRIIPVLQLHNRRLVKTINFKPKRYLGDPINAVRIFNLKQANELIINDISASETKNIDFTYLKSISAQAFIPLAYGGGIQSLEDVHNLYQIGFDRVILSTALYENPELVSQIAKVYGTQSIICSIETRKNNKYKIYYNGARKSANCSLKEIIKIASELGAGEIFLNNADRDGTYGGIDTDLICEAKSECQIPIIYCGGTKCISEALDALDNGVQAVAIGSLFSFYGKHKAVLINYYLE